MQVDNAKLRAYLDGELTESERKFVEKLLADSPEVQTALAQLRQERDRVAQILKSLAPTAETASPARWALKRFQLTHSNSDGQTAPSGSKSLPKQDDAIWESPSLLTEISINLKIFQHNWRQAMTKGFILATVVGLVIIIGAFTFALWPNTRQQVAEQIQEIIPSEIIRLPLIGEPNFQTTAVIVASQPISRGKKLTSALIHRREWPTKNLPAGFISDEAGVLGQRARVDITSGQIIAREMLVDSSGLDTPKLPPDVTPAPTVFNNEEIELSGRILFQRSSSGVYTIDANGSHLTRLTNGDSPTGSLDGQRIAFLASYLGQPEIYVMDANGANPTRLTYSPGVYLQPAWSPDGKKLAFTSGPADKLAIYVINADGTDQTKLADGLGPQWSPDGRQLAFSAYRANRYDIYVIDSDGRHLTKLTDGATPSWQPAWSPDGRQLAFLAKQDETDNVYIMNANGVNPTRLSRNPASAKINSQPAWSPDGQRLAFTVEVDNQTSLYTINADGSHQTRLTGDLNVSFDFAWSPDSQRLAFISYSEEHGGLFWVNVDGTHLTLLVKDAAGTFVEWLDTSQDMTLSPTPMITASLTIPITTSLSTATLAETPFGYGIQVSPRGDIEANIGHIKELGFGWVKLQMAWKEVEPSPGKYDWSRWDSLIDAYAAAGVKVMLSIPKAPDWARPTDDDKTIEGPPADLALYADFVAHVADRYRDKVQAIEIWNEQNLWYEAGGRGRISAANYVKLLQSAYTAVKSVNKKMLVVSGALTPASNVNDNVGTLALDDIEYLQQMYAAGVRDYFDALGAHPSGYNCPALADWRTVTPEEASADPTSGIFVQRHHSWCFLGTMEAYREVMMANDDGNKAIVITEFGWAVSATADPDMGYGYAGDNTPEEQAQWIVEAYQWGKQRGWVGPMILWNLDYNLAMPDTELTYFSLLDTPAYKALVEMPK